MLNPLDIHKKEFRRSFRGYHEEDVDMFLDQLARDYEELYTTNLQLKEQLERFETGMTRYRELEEVIKETLLMAQKKADNLRQTTEKEAQAILQKTRLETERKTEQAQRQAEQMLRAAEQKANQIINAAEEKSAHIIIEAEARVRETLKEYENLCNMARVFKIKFRSFLESQLEQLEEEPLKKCEYVTTSERLQQFDHLPGVDEAAAAAEPEDPEVF